MSYNNNHSSNRYDDRGHEYRGQKPTKVITTIRDLDLSQRFRSLSFESQNKWEDLMLMFVEFGVNYCHCENEPKLSELKEMLVDLKEVRKNNSAQLGTKRQEIKGDNADINSMQDELVKLRKQLDNISDSANNS